MLNATNAPGQNSSDHEWVGELMFNYRLGTGAWTPALTNQSADVRVITPGTNSVTVTYQNSANAKGIKNFKLVETYALVNDYLSWQITVTNTSTSTMEIGDFGLPLPFNEYWFASNDVIYETRTVYHSFTGNNAPTSPSNVPSGVGPFILMTPDATTGAGFEYMDNWVKSEHARSGWAAGGGTPCLAERPRRLLHPLQRHQEHQPRLPAEHQPHAGAGRQPDLRLQVLQRRQPRRRPEPPLQRGADRRHRRPEHDVRRPT